ncbi:MAG: class III poly(R)-hydroxyalkanoic acid synthase subunit PhaC [Xanthomonadales bacterium]|nr:class III poly(R)-hydroxyalkanoic acid synthase subunit PhaC [Xanthomonadales bacterium]
MRAIDITPDQIVREAAQFAHRIGLGLRHLAGLGPVEVGCTPREAVWREDKLVLYRFRRDTPARHRVPLLIVYALVNRPYMVDLQEDRSLVRNLLAQGYEIYLVDWGYPDPSDRLLGLEDYILGYLDRCARVVAERHGLEAIDLLGICQGGTFSLCYTALRPTRVRRLVTMVTPVDFHTPDNLLSHWTRELDVDLFVDTLGNVPADLMNFFYLTLKPYRLNLQKYVGLADILDDPAELANFLRMEKWIFDSPDQAGEAFRQFIRDFYQQNKLVRGEVEIGGERVDLGRITQPVLNVYATQDHLVPPEASRALARVVGSRDYTELAFRGGHIGIYVSARAQREVAPGIDRWLQEGKETERVARGGRA